MKFSQALMQLVAASCLITSASAQGEIGFVEKFALASDRESVLSQLVPGTEEYYFFHALHYQNTGQAQKLAAALTQWAQRFPDSAQRRILENRDALLAYDKDPKRTLEYLREHLGLRFDHVQEVQGRAPNLPAALDPARVSRAVFQQAALTDDGLNGVSEEMLEAFVRENVALRPAQRRALLARLTRPDVPGLVDWIATDLAARESRGFGEFNIHRALLPDQLAALVQKVPSLASQQAFVYARLRKLAPGADADGIHDPKAREAWLGRAWAYVKTLPPAYNSLKANVLYARLSHDRTRGVYDRARFLEYLKLPRRVAYMNPRYLEEADIARFPVDFNAEFPDLRLGNGPIGSDEALVREFVLQFAAADASWEPWAEWLRDTWVKPVFAEAKITAGAPNPEQWASLLTPAAYQALKDRVDIEFPGDNAAETAIADEPSVDVLLKHTPKIIIRVYELNTLGFLLTQARQPNTDVNLDGLVANEEQTQDGDPSPFRRVRRTFRFPGLKGRRGVWVIEFIGGGRSSRALIRKGGYTLVQRDGPAGDIITILDESRQPAKDAVAWVDGRKLEPSLEGGGILIPFSANPGPKAIVLADASGAFASLARFEHHAESYHLDAQFHLEREQLIAGRDATVGVRATLLAGHLAVTPELLLQNPVLTLSTTTLDGITTSTDIKAAGLSASRVFTNTFTVPDRLSSVTVTLHGSVEQLAKGGEKLELSQSKTWEINGINRTEAARDGHLSRFGNDYVFELLGKNGEAVPDQQVVFEFVRQGFSRVETVPLRSDPRGRIHLGALEEFESVSARTPNGRRREWRLEEAARTWPETVHARAGEVVKIPWIEVKKAGAVSLLEIAGGEFVADRTGAAKQAGAFLEISGLTPGDYSLRLRDTGEHTVVVRITEGTPAAGWLVGSVRSLELKPDAGLQIESANVSSNGVAVQLRHWTPLTRVHAAATRFLPDAGLFDSLAGFKRFGPRGSTPDYLPNLYSGGREIGDEYRYILERRYAAKFPGNLLPRPGLLLNPWEKRSTEAGTLGAVPMEPPSALADSAGALVSGKVVSPTTAVASEGAASSCLDFLADAAAVLFNLTPDTNGVVEIPAAALKDRQHLQLYAEDPFEAVWETVVLKERATRFRDLRLERNLDPALAFADSEDVLLLNKGATTTLPDALTGELSTYDTLGSVFGLFMTLNPDANLASFAWVTRWPTFNDAEKRAKYSEFACHELNFFLSRKDPKFFAAVVKPHLASKKDKTFLDEYLLDLDLKRWLAPWAYSRLNVAERALLAGRVPGEAAATARHLKELLELRPPDRERDERLFETGLRGRSLDENEVAGESVNRELRRMRAGFGMTGPAGEAANAYYLSGSAANAPGLAGFGGLALQDAPSDSSRKFKTRSGSRPSRRDAAKFGALEQKKILGRYSEMTLGLTEPETVVRLRAEAVSNAYYRLLGPAREWAENNYFHAPIAAQGPDLIPINGFWTDFAAWDGRSPFLSAHVAEAHHNFAEMMLALAVLDLPFEPAANTLKKDGPSVTLIADGPLIVFRRQFSRAAAQAGAAPLLVSEAFFRNDDRYQIDGGEKSEKFVTDEFVAGVVYGGHLVVSNPNASTVKGDLLTQIPKGALPVLATKPTQSRRLRLAPYGTEQFEYYFYFPEPAADSTALPHFPSSATVAGRPAGAARAQAFRVVRELSKGDTRSWDYVSQQADNEEVLSFLEGCNLAQLDLGRAAWRAKGNVDFFRRLIRLLDSRHVWNETLYSYAVYHNDPDSLREWLQHRDDFLSQCGAWLDCPLVRIDPVARARYEHLEYAPYVNQRAHRIGAENRIANAVVREQYSSLLGILSYKATPDPADQLAVVYYLFLQDRVEEALARFHALPANAVATRVQYDYLACYAAFYEDKTADARSIAARYADYPVDRWKALFAEVTAQLDEAEGKPASRPGGPPNRERQQSELAAAAPSFDFKVDNRTVSLNWANLAEVTINYYLMDPEFSFSSSPFVSGDSDRFGIVKPTLTERRPLPAGKDTLDLPLPERFARANVLVEILGGGHRKAHPYHANTFKLVLAENQGRLEVRDAVGGKPVSKAYVKVYARLGGGEVRFLKDGYTDLRGRFDYASVNSGATAPGDTATPAGAGIDHPTLRPDEAARIDRIALLVLSDAQGAAVREVGAPSL